MRLKILDVLARVLGIQFHIDGLPFGAKVTPPIGVSGSTLA